MFFSDSIDYECLLNIGLNVQKLYETVNTCVPTVMNIYWHVDHNGTTFFTYIASYSNPDPSMRPEIFPHTFFTITPMIARITKRKQLNFVKKIHRSSHDNSRKMIMVMADSVLGSSANKNACNEVYISHPISKSTGRLYVKETISFTDVNDTFHEEHQADFVTISSCAENMM